MSDLRNALRAVVVDSKCSPAIRKQALETLEAIYKLEGMVGDAIADIGKAAPMKMVSPVPVAAPVAPVQLRPNAKPVKGERIHRGQVVKILVDTFRPGEKFTTNQARDAVSKVIPPSPLDLARYVSSQYVRWHHTVGNTIGHLVTEGKLARECRADGLMTYAFVSNQPAPVVQAPAPVAPVVDVPPVEEPERLHTHNAVNLMQVYLPKDVWLSFKEIANIIRRHYTLSDFDLARTGHSQIRWHQTIRNAQANLRDLGEMVRRIHPNSHTTSYKMLPKPDPSTIS